MIDERSPRGFKFEHDQTSISAWGATIEEAFEETLTGLMHAAGAPLGAKPGARSRTLDATGASPAQALDKLAMHVWETIREGERFDGGVSMGGVVRGDEGWRCWASFGLADEGAAAIRAFEVMKEPRVERKPGKVKVKAQFLVWLPEMDELIARFREIDELNQLHLGGIVGPAIE